MDRSPSCAVPGGVPADAVAVTDPAGVSAALARAADTPGATRVLLVTDAVFDGVPGLPGVPVDVRLCERRDDVGIEALRAPARIAPGADFGLAIAVGRTAGPGAGVVRATVRIERDGQRVGQPRAVLLERGQTVTVRVRDRVANAGMAAYRAVLSGTTAAPGNDEATAVVRVGDLPNLLAVGPGAVPDGFHVQRTDAAGAAAMLARPGRIDAVLLRGSLPSLAAQERLIEAVRGGAGLVVHGGAGFGGRPLEQVLPLTDQPPGGRATILLLDYSGSMSPLRDRLAAAVRRLVETLPAAEQVAILVFRDRVVLETPWGRADTTVWRPADELRATGNTSLAPAVERAERLFAQVGDTRKRLFVVSDGNWQDLATATERLKALTGVFRAAVLLEAPRAPATQAPFDLVVASGDALAESLKEVERRTPDRRVPGPITPRAASVATWLRPVLPANGPYAGAVRLYARGVGEKVALRQADHPLLATLEPGGRVAVVALDDAPLDGVLRACARPAGDIEIEAERDGTALEVRARIVRGPVPEAFVVDGRAVPARPAGPGRMRARVERIDDGPLTVAYGAARRRVPARSATELRGLTNRPDIAAEIARRSGGRVIDAGAAEPPASKSPAVYSTLLLAIACVVWGASRRAAA
ncbi:MAG: vWA domain-containing protein [Planctomycetota bacterium]